MDNIVRISKISIKNIKNTKSGEIFFNNGENLEKGSITGLYGQNGSGKTSAVEALRAIEYLLSDDYLDASFDELIMKNMEVAKLEAEFYIDCKGHRYSVFYLVEIKRNTDKKTNNINNKIEVISENLSIRDISKKKRKTVLIEIKKGEKNIEITPKRKIENIMEKRNIDIVDLLVSLKMNFSNGRSFIFSEDGLNLLEDNIIVKYENDLLKELKRYATGNLFIFSNRDSAMSTLDLVLAMSVHYSRGRENARGSIPVKLREPSIYDKEIFHLIEGVVDQMNIVLPVVIPNLKLEIYNHGEQLMDDNETIGIKFEILSNRNGVKIPIRMESEGIKKIISMLSALIAGYNNPTVTIVIDELDSGVFEYLLGELLIIFQEGMKGQLIFTSHNLRILEVLNNKNIVFTTMDDSCRYVDMKSTSATSNNRNVYLRDIYLESEKPILYDKTDSGKMKRAFRRAGKKNV